MLQFLNLKPEIFGLDINDSTLRIAKLEKKRSGFVLVSFNEVEIPQGIVEERIIKDEDTLAKIIRTAIKTVKGKKISTNYVVSSLPEEKSFSRVIQMPKMSEEELKSAVPFEAENYIPLTIDKVYLDFQVIATDKENSNHSDLLIAATPKTIVDSYVSCFKKAELVPHTLEVESQAVVRALVKNEKSLQPLIFVDIGKTDTNFIIFSGKSVRFTCSLPVSSDQITLAISQGLNVGYNEAENLKIKYGLSKENDKASEIAKIINPILKELVLQIKKYINFYHDHVFHEYFPSDEIGRAHV